MINVFKPVTFLLIVCLVLACGGNGGDPSPGDNSKDRGAILTYWADEIIIPSYTGFQSQLDVMAEKSQAFTAAPGETSLTDFRSAWIDAYIAWQKVELFEFGPADKYTLRSFFNIYPADVNGILANVENPGVNLDLPAAYAQQGFPAIDYLINGIGTDDATILAAYTSHPDAAKRLAYIERLVERMQQLLDNVTNEWSGAYKETFVSRTGLDIGSSFGLVVNAFVLYYERYVRSGKIGIPSGAAIGSTGVPYPEKTEAFYHNEISRTLAKTAHAASMQFFNGHSPETNASGPSLSSYLDGLGAKDPSTSTPLSQLINDQFEVISNELDQLLPSLAEQIETDNSQMVETYAEMQKLVRMLKVDMTSAMSVTITYTDNDGD